MSSNLEHSLRERPTSWLAFDQRRFLLLAGPIGGREVFFDASGALYAYTPLNDWAVKAALDKARAANATPETIPSETLAVLTKGEAAYLELRARLATGAIGWKIHTELLVIEVAGSLYNTEFKGDVATSYTKFAETESARCAASSSSAPRWEPRRPRFTTCHWRDCRAWSS